LLRRLLRLRRGNQCGTQTSQKLAELACNRVGYRTLYIATTSICMETTRSDHIGSCRVFPIRATFSSIFLWLMVCMNHHFPVNRISPRRREGIPTVSLLALSVTSSTAVYLLRDLVALSSRNDSIILLKLYYVAPEIPTHYLPLCSTPVHHVSDPPHPRPPAIECNHIAPLPISISTCSSDEDCFTCSFKTAYECHHN